MRQLGRPEPDKPLRVLAFDEARFGLINWHRKHYSARRGFVHPTHRQACLRMDLPVCSSRAYSTGEFLPIPAGDE
jgi:hypothetical protein